MIFPTLNFSRQQNIFRAPKNREASILVGKHIANAKEFSIVLKAGWMARQGDALLYDRWLAGWLAGLAGWLAGLGWLTGRDIHIH